METKSKRKNVDEQGTSSHREERLVRLSYPASEKMVIILPIETRQVMDTSGDIFPARLLRASGIGSGGMGEGRYQLGVKLRRKRVIRGRQILYPSLALMILLGPCIKAASLNEPQMLGKDVAVNLLETPSLVKNPSEDVGGNIKFLSSIPPKMEPVSTKKPDQRGKNSKPFGVDEEREKINKRWHNGITALVTLIGGFFVGDWVAARQTAKKRDLKFSSNVERTRGGEPSSKTSKDAARRRVSRLVRSLFFINVDYRTKDLETTNYLLKNGANTLLGTEKETIYKPQHTANPKTLKERFVRQDIHFSLRKEVFVLVFLAKYVNYLFRKMFSIGGNQFLLGVDQIPSIVGGDLLVDDVKVSLFNDFFVFGVHGGDAGNFSAK